jgi:drug/metabolite transporter (DMT)-like permease
MMNWNKWKGPFLLFLAAMVWGASFVSQDIASESIGPFTFNGLRMTLGGLVLLPVVAIKNKGRLFPPSATPQDKKRLFLGGVVCGSVLFFAAWFQQLGIDAGTTPGKSGFITAMYVILVPIVGLFMKKRVRPLFWGCVLLAVVGLYFLCMVSFSNGISGLFSNLTLEKGDLFTLLCALCFTFHIMVVDHFAPTTDGVFLSSIQFLFAGSLGILCMFLLEQPTLSGITMAGGALLYSGLFSSGVGYTFQILGQKSTPPALASIIMCLESVFALLSESLVTWTLPSPEEAVGCTLLFVAIVAANLLDIIPKKKA